MYNEGAVTTFPTWAGPALFTTVLIAVVAFFIWFL
jgi:hypothetical protein